MVSWKISKTIGLLRKLQNLLPRAARITICKAFIRPNLDYGDILYDQVMFFHRKLEFIQYNACLVITEAISGTFKEKFYQELGLESLQLRHWYRKLVMLMLYIYIYIQTPLVGFWIRLWPQNKCEQLIFLQLLITFFGKQRKRETKPFGKLPVISAKHRPISSQLFCSSLFLKNSPQQSSFFVILQSADWQLYQKTILELFSEISKGGVLQDVSFAIYINNELPQKTKYQNILKMLKNRSK